MMRSSFLYDDKKDGSMAMPVAASALFWMNFLLCISGHESGNDFTGDIRQPVSSSQMFIGESFVIDAHEAQDGRVKIVHMHRIFHDVVTEFIGFAVHAGFTPPPAIQMEKQRG